MLFLQALTGRFAHRIPRNTPRASLDLIGLLDRDEKQKHILHQPVTIPNRGFHATKPEHFKATHPTENVTILGISFGIATAALGAKYTIQAYDAYKSRPEEEKKAGETWYARNYYDGPFEDKMTRREAALILGVRSVLPFQLFQYNPFFIKNYFAERVRTKSGYEMHTKSYWSSTTLTRAVQLLSRAK